MEETRWMIHFVRGRNPELDCTPTIPAEFTAAASDLGVDASAFAVLQNIVTYGGIIPGYAIRGFRSTVPDGKPVVCAIDMPLLKFADHSEEYDREFERSCYGIAFRQSAFYTAGGRPVSYVDIAPEAGDCDLSYLQSGPDQPRFWRELGSGPEWRWRASKPIDTLAINTPLGYKENIPALRLFGGTEQGSPFDEVCLIVKSADEAEALRSIFTWLYFSQENDAELPYCRHVLRNSFVLVLDELRSAVASGEDSVRLESIDGAIDAGLANPLVTLSERSEGLEQKIRDAFDSAKVAGIAAGKKASRNIRPQSGLIGFARVYALDPLHPVAQSIYRMGLARATELGRFDLELPSAMSMGQSANVNYVVAEAFAQALSSKLDTGFGFGVTLD